MRPLSVGELLDAAFSAVRRNFGQLVLCTLVVVVPVSVLNTLITSSSNDQAFHFGSTRSFDDRDFGLMAGGTVATIVISLIAQTLTIAACLRAIGGEVVGSPVGAGTSLRYALRRLLPLFWVAVLHLLAVLAGVVMCLVGAVWTWGLFSMALPALLFEEQRGVGAMRRSQRLVEGHFWRVFGALVVGALIALVLSAMLRGLLDGVILASSDSELLNASASTLVTIVALAVTTPFSAALTGYVYFDLRVRKEGFDLALLARGIGTAEPGAATSVAGLPVNAPPSSGFLPPQPPPPPGG